MSKFEGIRRAKQLEQKTEISGTQKSGDSAIQNPGTSGTQSNKTGRTRGKRLDPSYEQVTAYLPKEIHRRVKVKLLEQGETQAFSKLVGELLKTWLGS